MLRVLVATSFITMYLPLVMPEYKDNVDRTKMSSQNEDIVFRVVNGKPASLGTVPYQLSLKAPINRYQYRNYCGGSIIAKDKILSAAHCFTKKGNSCQKICKKFQKKDLKKLYAVAGTLRNLANYKSDSEGTEQWRKMTKAFIPPGYWFPKNDICVAYTSAPFVFNTYVKPLPPASRYMDYGSIDCLVSGYGKISKFVTSEILLWAKLRLIPQRTCSRLHRENMNKFICTSSDYTNVLQGDSGGPLVCRGTNDPNDKGEGVIVGVVSGAKVGRYGSSYKTFFTRVSSYVRFYTNGDETMTLNVFYIIWLLLIITNLT